MRKTALIVTLLTVATVATAQMKKNAPPAASKPGSPVQAVPMPVQKPTADAATRIKIEDAWKLYQADKAVFVDVRSKESFDKGHIKGALSIPGSQLIRRFREIPPNKVIVTYCACSAEQSSGQAVVELNAHGVKNTAALVGGWQSWKDSGKPTEVSR
jgi:rhodanese-related sulfurtransferase